LQGFIYDSISPKLARKLHDRGFPVGKRKFKLFTFSRILGEYSIDKRKGLIAFSSPFSLVVSSAMKDFIEEVAQELIRKESARIASENVFFNSVEVSSLDIDKEKLKIKMLSPVTIYSTLSHADGRKKTYYYSPFEDEFSRLISENARKKFKAFYKKEPRGEIKVTPLKVNSGNQKIMSYKETIIKGWTGIYELSGDRELMKLAYDAGLGGKNSQGFGCFEVV
jgi:CRISPR-associated endoribonuclease Cas6